MDKDYEKSKTKTCCKCKATKDLNLFYRCVANKDGFQYKCKDCAAVGAKVWYTNNQEKILKKAKEKYASDPEKHRKRSMDWHWNNRDRSISRGKKWTRRRRSGG
jgi:hypothetical protein